MKKLALLYFLMSAFVCGVATAQTFAPGSAPSAKKTEPAVNHRIGTDKPLRQTMESLQNSAAEDENVVEEETDYEVLTPAKNTLGSFGRNKDDDEKKYDNSLGTVFEIRFDDDGVVFENDDDNRKILVYYDNYKLEKGMDNLVHCSFRLYVLNDMTEKLSNISLKLKWPEISTNVQMVQVNPGVRTYIDTMLLGNGCYTMDKTPVIEVNRCRVKGKTEEQCAAAVHWFNINQ